MSEGEKIKFEIIKKDRLRTHSHRLRTDSFVSLTTKYLSKYSNLMVIFFYLSLVKKKFDFSKIMM
jgi:hypothetical protein